MFLRILTYKLEVTKAHIIDTLGLTFEVIDTINNVTLHSHFSYHYHNSWFIIIMRILWFFIMA